MIEKIVYALVEANVSLILDGEPGDCQEEAGFVLGQLYALPGIFRLGMMTVTVLVNFGAGLLHRRSLEARRRAVQRLNQTALPVLKDFAAFYQGLTVLAHYSREAGDNA